MAWFRGGKRGAIKLTLRYMHSDSTWLAQVTQDLATGQKGRGRALRGEVDLSEGAPWFHSGTTAAPRGAWLISTDEWVTPQEAANHDDQRARERRKEWGDDLRVCGQRTLGRPVPQDYT